LEVKSKKIVTAQTKNARSSLQILYRYALGP